MSDALQTLPFNFGRLDASNAVLLSNMAGAFEFLENPASLSAIAAGSFNDLSAEIRESLLAKNFLSCDDEVDVRMNQLATHLASANAKATQGPALFMVVPTLRCDHRCQYCQVSRVPKDRQGYDLLDNSIDEIIGLIAKSQQASIKIEFQGGEPLLNFPYIQEFVHRATRALSDKDVSFVICSALGPLNDEIIEWARVERVVFSTSLDGRGHVHRSNRPSKYFDSYEKTISGIRWLQKELGSERVSCLATVSRGSLDEPVELVHEYFNLGLESIFVRSLSPFGFASPQNTRIAYTPDEFFAFYQTCLAEVVALNKERRFIEESAAIHFRRIFRPGDAGYVDLQSPAGYLFGAIVFNYDGQIFGSDEARMLWESTKAPELVLGRLGDEPKQIFGNQTAAKLLQGTFLFAQPGCDDCVFQPYCGADPMHHLATQGDHIGNKSLSNFCRLQRLMYGYFFEQIHSQSKIAQTVSSWLTH